jgi:hypothetical protein
LFSSLRLSSDLIFFLSQQFEVLSLTDEDTTEEDYPSDWERYSPSYLEENFPSDLDSYPQPVFNPQFPSHFDLGTVSTAVNSAANLAGCGTGKILSFPNWIQVFSFLKKKKTYWLS